jgi:hypothetical protein
VATARLVWNSLLSQLKTATTGLLVLGNSAPVQCQIDWPSVGAIQNIARGGVLVSLFDRGESKVTTRWLKFRATPLNINPTGITTRLSMSLIPGTETATITLGGIVNANDAVSAVVQSGPTTLMAVAIATGADTPTTMATKLATAINEAETLNTWITASVSGSVVTIINNLAVTLKAASNVGNTATRQVEVGRVKRDVQITVWTQIEEAREVIGDVIELLLYQLQTNFGVALADGTYARVVITGDHHSKDTALQDVYRRDFFIDVEYGVTYEEQAWAVLGIIPSYSAS